MDERGRDQRATPGPTPGWTASRRASGIVAELEAEGLLEKTEPHRGAGRPLPALRHGGRAAPVAAVVREDGSRWPSRRSRRWRTAASASSPRAGPRPTSTGWRTSATGASRASSGGATASRSGTATTCGELTVAREAPTRPARKCGGATSRQETDVLDTWFSSGLWPFSTLGWPDETRRPRALLPDRRAGDGLDIIFFWVARMMMVGMRFMGDVPVPRPSSSTASCATSRARRCRSRSATSSTRSTSIDAVRRRRAALHARRAGRAGQDAAARRGAAARLPRLRQQDLERVALRRCMNLEAASARPAYDARGALPAAQPLDPVPPAGGGARGGRGAGRVPLRRGGERRSTTSSGARSATGTSRSRSRPRRTGRRRRGDARACWSRCSSRRCACCIPFMPFVTEEIWQALPHEGAVDHDRAVPECRSRASWTSRPKRPWTRVMRLVTAIRTMRATYEVDRKRRIDVTRRRARERRRGVRRASTARSCAHLARPRRPSTWSPRPRRPRRDDRASPWTACELRVPMAGLFDVAAEKARLPRSWARSTTSSTGLRQEAREPAVRRAGEAGGGGPGAREACAELQARGRRSRPRWRARPAGDEPRRAVGHPRRRSRAAGRIVRAALDEDVGARDVTTEATVARRRARAGVFWPSRSWSWRAWTSRSRCSGPLDPQIAWEPRAREGDRFDAGHRRSRP